VIYQAFKLQSRATRTSRTKPDMTRRTITASLPDRLSGSLGSRSRCPEGQGLSQQQHRVNQERAAALKVRRPACLASRPMSLVRSASSARTSGATISECVSTAKIGSSKPTRSSKHEVQLTAPRDDLTTATPWFQRLLPPVVFARVLNGTHPDGRGARAFGLYLGSVTFLGD
jgi:hypothetical protein